MQILVGTTPLAYRVSGAPMGTGRPVIIFLHGWGRSKEDFDGLIALLTKRFPSASFLQLDLPGFGGSPLTTPEGLSIAEYAETLKVFLDKLGLPQVALVGHSFGGRIAIKFTAMFPERVERLVLISAAGVPQRSPRLTLLAFGRSLFRTLLSAIGDYRFILRLKNLLGAVFGSRDYRQASGALRETFKKTIAEDMRRLATMLRCPALLVWGVRDEITTLRDGETYRALITGSRLETLDGGHFAFLEQPEACARLIASFLLEQR